MVNKTENKEKSKKIPKRPIVFSGVQPSGKFMLGNYLGALKNWVELQKDHDCIFSVVDQHAITTRHEPKQVKELTYEVLATYVAAGINPSKCTMFVQSQVPEHSELCWILGCHAYMGELSRMTQFKDKSGSQKNIGLGILIYPILMAADILLYQTNLVPVGQDQKQHLELTRDLAQRFNNAYNCHLFTIPEPLIAKTGSKVMSLQEPTKKMSKSDTTPNATIYLTDTDEQIMKKIKRAVTDSGTEITDDPAKPGVQNLLGIQTAITGKSMDEIVESYKGKQYGHLKVETAEIVVEAIRPIRKEIEDLMKDKSYLDKLASKGTEIARNRAQITLTEVKEFVGLVV